MAQDNASNVAISAFDADILFAINQYSVTPTPFCTLEYECESVTWDGVGDSPISCDNFTSDFDFSQGDASDGTMNLTVDSSLYGSYEPGNYTINLLVNVTEATTITNGTTNKPFTFDFELTDPCDGPVSLVVDTATDANYDYKITDTFTPVANTTFTISPDFCLYEVDSMVGPISGGGM